MVGKKIHKGGAKQVREVYSKLTLVFPITLILLGALILTSIYFISNGHAAPAFRNDDLNRVAEVAFETRDFHETPVAPMAQGVVRNYVSGNNKLIPILMYHHVRNYIGSDAIERGLSTQPEALAAQLKWIKDSGYTTVTLPELFAGQVTDKSIVLTFDDGYRDNYEAALPMLKENGQKATFFIITGATGASALFMTSDMLREMSNAGMDIESHTVNHIDMGKANKQTLDSQLSQSKATLEALTGKPVSFLCYPSGQFSPLAETETKAVGYKAAMTTQPFAKSANLYEIPRIRMNPGESPQTLASVISAYLGASNRYNWNF